MLLAGYKKFRLAQSLLPGAHQSATKLAFATALGLMLGLVPKGNLVAAAIATIILATTVHKAMALLTAFLVSMGSGLVDPLAHRIGRALLTADTLTPTWSKWMDLPLVAWTELNNTVVMGSTVCGLALFFPVYRLSRPLFQRYWVRSNNRDAADKVAAQNTIAADGQPTHTAAAELDASTEPLGELAAKRQVAHIAAELEMHRCDIRPIGAGRSAHGPHGLPLKPIAPGRRFAAFAASAAAAEPSDERSSRDDATESPAANRHPTLP